MNGLAPSGRTDQGTGRENRAVMCGLLSAKEVSVWTGYPVRPRERVRREKRECVSDADLQSEHQLVRRTCGGLVGFARR